MKRPNCNICGRLARARRDADGNIIRNQHGEVAEWRFSCVTREFDTGMWEHE